MRKSLSDRGIVINRSLFIANLRRYWPWAAFMLFVYVVTAILQYINAADWGFGKAEYITDESSSMFLAIFAMLSGLIASILCFRYLMKHREAIMAHSLPLRRESHLLTAAASGFALLGAPIIIGGLLFFAAYGVNGYFAPVEALLWIAANLSISYMLFGVTAFFAMTTGNSIAHWILTLIFTNLPLLVEAALIEYCNRFLFGFISWTPVTFNVNPYYHIGNYIINIAENFKHGDLPDFLTPAIFLLTGLLFLALAALLYKRRRIESAGDVIAVRHVRPFLRYGSALAFAFLFGLIYGGAGGSQNRSIAGELAFSILGGAFGFFLAEMFIRRTVHVFKRYYAGAIGFSLCFAVVVLALFYDVPGYGRMKLDADKVDVIVVNSISARVRAALLGEETDFYGTLSDLDIDDPGGYFQGRIYGKVVLPGKPIPPNIARQIIEQDFSVMRGGDTKTAVELQHIIAENARRFSNKTANYSSNTYGYNDVSNFSIPFIARYKDGRIVRRNYDIRLYKNRIDEQYHDDTPEADFLRLKNEIEVIRRLSDMKQLVKCASHADYLDITFNFPINESYKAEESAAIDRKSVTQRVTLNRGEWAGLMDAYEQDFQQAKGLGDKQTNGFAVTDDMSSPSFYGKNNGAFFASAEFSMPDKYLIHFNIKWSDINTIQWFVRKGIVDEEKINK